MGIQVGIAPRWLWKGRERPIKSQGGRQGRGLLRVLLEALKAQAQGLPWRELTAGQAQADSEVGRRWEQHMQRPWGECIWYSKGALGRPACLRQWGCVQLGGGGAQGPVSSDFFPNLMMICHDELPWRALSKKLMRPDLRYGSLFGCWVEKGLESSREVREEVAAGFEEENGGACLTLGPWD